MGTTWQHARIPSPCELQCWSKASPPHVSIVRARSRWQGSVEWEAKRRSQRERIRREKRSRAQGKVSGGLFPSAFYRVQTLHRATTVFFSSLHARRFRSRFLSSLHFFFFLLLLLLLLRSSHLDCAMASRALVVDNGASTVKFGFADDDLPYRSLPNNITRSKAERRSFVGDQISACKDFSGLYYRLPFEKGLLTDWDVEKQIWDRLFTGKIMPVCSAVLANFLLIRHATTIMNPFTNSTTPNLHSAILPQRLW